MNDLQVAIAEVAKAVNALSLVALADDKTPLGNAIALRDAASLVGGGGDNPRVVVFGDLNQFKSINDQHGHDAGDAAISQVGRMIKTLLVEGCNCQAFRKSGDEFVLLLSEDALDPFLRIASAFASCPFSFNDQLLETSMSFGYAPSERNVDFNELLVRAETACQIAKSQGAGTCVQWTEELQQTALVSLRARCQSCGAKISCDVPVSTTPKDKKLNVCPCCGSALSSPRTTASGGR